ncbi:dimethyladenosine transferase 1, mitochondrial [Platysternon megacephalum]|uniref:Dimethyladenosine transferase 1, mitochondrial n=1 Tax=Platysternon megacephalum TaxID=55544 RepID=A0A4D9EKU5_9SAUR|nr:dimethyladenosine transferase 1, mitochondrial [Platysternon megacephalum]
MPLVVAVARGWIVIAMCSSGGSRQGQANQSASPQPQIMPQILFYLLRHQAIGRSFCQVPNLQLSACQTHLESSAL